MPPGDRFHANWLRHMLYLIGYNSTMRVETTKVYLD